MPPRSVAMSAALVASSCLGFPALAAYDESGVLPTHHAINEAMPGLR